MCCLFGFYHYGGGEIDKLSGLTNLLAKNAAVRGTDAYWLARKTVKFLRDKRV